MVMYRGMPKATKAELAYLAQVKELPCCVCPEAPGRDQQSPTEAHHIVQGKRLGHFFCLPLCAEHHELVTSARWMFEQIFSSQRSLWEKTNAKLGVSREWPASKVVPRRVA